MSVLRLTQAEVDTINARNRALKPRPAIFHSQVATTIVRERGEPPRKPQAGKKGGKNPLKGVGGRNRGKQQGYERRLAEQCHALGLPPPVLEYRFHPVRKWRIDLAWPDRLLAVEVEGAVHRIHKQFDADILRQQALFFEGWRLLRIATRQVRDGTAVKLIQRAFLPIWPPDDCCSSLPETSKQPLLHPDS